MTRYRRFDPQADPELVRRRIFWFGRENAAAATPRLNGAAQRYVYLPGVEYTVSILRFRG